MVLCEREPDVSNLFFPYFFSFFFLSNFQISKDFISLFSGTERLTKLKLGPDMNSRSMYHVYLNRATGAYLFLYFFSFFLSQNSKTLNFLSHFSVRPTKLKLDRAMGLSVVYTKYKQPEYICSFIFLLFFCLSLQLAD